MIVVSAFFADYASVHDNKLFVQGGVWDWYGVSQSDLPLETAAAAAVVLQIAPEDRGRDHELVMTTLRPDGEALGPSAVIKIGVSSDFMADHLILTPRLALTFETHGRYVTLFEVGSEAFALPLKVIEPPA